MNEILALYPAPLSEATFGDPGPGRRRRRDPRNKAYFQKLFFRYIDWQQANGKFYEGFEYDRTKAKMLFFYQYGLGALGVLFAGMIFNPVYTGPRAFYLRKINLALFFILFSAYGRKVRMDHTSMMLLRMNDYLPVEVRRAIESQDYRHLALFDYENIDRQLFDPETGKSLS